MVYKMETNPLSFMNCCMHFALPCTALQNLLFAVFLKLATQVHPLSDTEWCLVRQEPRWEHKNRNGLESQNKIRYFGEFVFLPYFTHGIVMGMTGGWFGGDHMVGLLVQTWLYF